MTDILFYHLQHAPLEQVLPTLLEKTLERGWKAVVQAGSAERLAALDSHLWTYRDESFLPHGTKETGDLDKQPVALVLDDDNPNGSNVRFYVDGASVGDVSAYERAVYIFDGSDESQLQQARSQWKTLKAAEHNTTYWQQTERGRWEQKA
ncbi:DNA polymerase III subunit chi [Coralliovum pocilloporae]|uniref:DNA polymerase III subunit chi n=1 Tax=Coralliovum pocilloporae TaxID=3066369 RepID=UPI0033072442